MNISIDRTDLWDLRPVPEFSLPECTYQQLARWRAEGRDDEIRRMFDEPYMRPMPTRLPAGRIQASVGSGAPLAGMRLALGSALASVDWEDGSRAEILVHADRPVGYAVFHRCAVDFHLSAPPFAGTDPVGAVDRSYSISSLNQLGYPGPDEAGGPGWLAYSQEGALGFRFAVYLAWRAVSGEIHAAWSIASSSEGENPLEIARARVNLALEEGYEGLLRSHKAWWDTYWHQSSIQLPNRLLERQWALEQYKFGSASRRGAPPITLQGPWTTDNGELPPWKGDYHHDLNTQLSYWPCYTANHLEEGLSYLDWLWDTRDHCRAWTKHFFNAPGLNVPGVADLLNRPIGGWVMYSFSATTGAWLAHHFYLHWRYSADRTFLKERAYPYVREAAVFIEAITSEKDADGFRTLALSASPEINNNRLDAWFPSLTNYDLALIRWLLGAAAELAEELVLEDESRHWRELQGSFPGLALGHDGRLLIAADRPLTESHRHFSHLMAIHPLGLIDWEDGENARQTIRASLEELERLGPGEWCGYSYAWLGCLAARARDGERAEKALTIFSTAFTLPNSFHVNGDQSGLGYSNFTYRPFTLEGNFACAAGIQEMLLQSHGGAIRVFPAVPEAWADVSFTGLRAEGGFILSAERRGSLVQWVEVTAEVGGDCRLASPFGGRDRAIKLAAGQSVRLSRDEA